MTDELWRPPSAFVRRMRELASQFPPKLNDTLAEASLVRIANSSLDVRLRVKSVIEKLPSFMNTRTFGGTKLPMSESIRWYFREYQERLSSHGLDGMPSSFNVIEGFLAFSQEFLNFDIREEREHLLRLDDYIDWYTSETFPSDHRALIDVYEEGVAYEYNMVEPTQSYRIRIADAELAIVGISMIRHANELSTYAIIGESPPHPSDEQLSGFTANTEVVAGREGIAPHPSLDIGARYLPEMPGFGRVVALGRFDLTAHSFDVRYINVDVGPSYRILTDDPSGFREGGHSAFEHGREMLERYDSIFALVVSSLYLPVFFIAESQRVDAVRFATDLHAERTSAPVQTAVRVLGEGNVPFYREVRCMASSSEELEDSLQTLRTPEFDLTSSGFWKTLSPTQVGEDADGNPIVGRTWVERTEWNPRRSLRTLVLARPPLPPRGADPGTLYVVRSAAHGSDVYKIGLTRREAATRATELSRATGVPTPFEVLASWEVGDVARLERDVHGRLAACRLSTRREFFRAPLSKIVSAINQALEVR